MYPKIICQISLLSNSGFHDAPVKSPLFFQETIFLKKLEIFSYHMICRFLTDLYLENEVIYPQGKGQINEDNLKYSEIARGTSRFYFQG